MTTLPKTRATFAILLASLALTGCHALRRSPAAGHVARARAAAPTQPVVVRTREALTAAGIEHRLVVFAFPIETARRGSVMTTRAAILYRDDAHPANPWWLTDERLHQPLWLPNGPVEHQLSFYVRARVDVISAEHFRPAQGKNVFPAESKAATAATAPAERPGAVTRIVRTVAKVLHLRHESPAPPVPIRRAEPVTRIVPVKA